VTTTTSRFERLFVIDRLKATEQEFKAILNSTNIDDSTSFSEEEVATLTSAYVDLSKGKTRTRTLSSARSLPTSSTSVPMGESQPTGTSQIAGGFQELLDGQYLTLEAQVNSALASHREKVENLLGGALDEALDIPFQVMEDFQDSQAIVGATALSLPQSQA
jgi:hypothetical protein